jgi:hypothetical protein
VVVDVVVVVVVVVVGGVGGSGGVGGAGVHDNCSGWTKTRQDTSAAVAEPALLQRPHFF